MSSYLLDLRSAAEEPLAAELDAIEPLRAAIGCRCREWLRKIDVMERHTRENAFPFVIADLFPTNSLRTEGSRLTRRAKKTVEFHFATRSYSPLRCIAPLDRRGAPHSRALAFW